MPQKPAQWPLLEPLFVNLTVPYPGLKRVWLRSIKSQTKQAAFVMEFESEKALEDYAGSEAQKTWYKLYLPIREQSVTSDITN